MDKIKRIDFEMGYTDSDGEFIEGMTEKVTVLYNESVINYEEVCKLIDSDMYEYDCRIVVTTPIQAANLRGEMI